MHIPKGLLALAILLAPCALEAGPIINIEPHAATQTLNAILKDVPESLRPLAYENYIADMHGILRIRYNESVSDFARRAQLEPVPAGTATFFIRNDVPEDLSYLTTPAHQFLKYISFRYCSFAGKRLEVTSLLRTWARHYELIKAKISDADCITHYRCSPHLTGATFDITKRGMTTEETEWVWEMLVHYMARGVVHAINEPHHFHILVTPSWNDVRFYTVMETGYRWACWEESPLRDDR